MKYRIIIEHDPGTGHYTATVAGLPGLVVDATHEDEAIRLATEAIPFYLEEVSATPAAKAHLGPLPTKVVEVEV